MKNNSITAIVDTLKSGKSITSIDLPKLNPIEKDIIRIVANEKMTPGLSELVDKLIDLSDMVSGKTDAPFLGSCLIYDVFDSEYLS